MNKFYVSGSGRIEIEMSFEQAESASHSGSCDDDVLALSNVPAIKKQLENIDIEVLKNELSEFGAWDDKDLMDYEQNIQRILWIAAGDISDGNCQE